MSVKWIFLVVSTSRIGIWLGLGIESALAARAELGRLQDKNPNADWFVLGPLSSLFLFEMDVRVLAYIPLAYLEPPRSSQSQLSYFLEKYKQKKKLKDLKLSQCIGIAILATHAKVQQNTERQFHYALNSLGVSGYLIQKELSFYLLQTPRPVLQAGFHALTFATQYHRKSPPNCSRVLVLFSQEDALNPLSQSSRDVFEEQKLIQKTPMHLTVAVLGDGGRLVVRQLAKIHPEWLFVNIAQAMGLIAYADRVICNIPLITLICAEMGRSRQLVLGNADI